MHVSENLIKNSIFCEFDSERKHRLISSSRKSMERRTFSRRKLLPCLLPFYSARNGSEDVGETHPTNRICSLLRSIISSVAVHRNTMKTTTKCKSKKKNSRKLSSTKRLREKNTIGSRHRTETDRPTQQTHQQN